MRCGNAVQTYQRHKRLFLTDCFLSWSSFTASAHGNKEYPFTIDKITCCWGSVWIYWQHRSRRSHLYQTWQL